MEQNPNYNQQQPQPLHPQQAPQAPQAPFDPNNFRVTGVDNIQAAMDQYGGSTSEFFTLKDNLDSAKVLFLHGDANDMDSFVVHKVNIGGSDRYVACLAPQGLPCPVCHAGVKPQFRCFIQLVDLADKKRKLWDRGKAEMATLLGRITKFGPLNTRIYEVTRKGKANDTKTTYDIIPDGQSFLELNTTATAVVPGVDLARQDIIGADKFVLVKTPAELEVILSQGGLNTKYATNPAPAQSFAYAPQQPQAPQSYYPPAQPYQAPQQQYQAPSPQQYQAPQQQQYQAPAQQQYQAPVQQTAPQQPAAGVTMGYADQAPGAPQAPPAQGATYFTPAGPSPALTGNIRL